VMAGSAILTLSATAFIQAPIQIWIGQMLGRSLGAAVLKQWLLVAAIPQILVGGLIQEGAKLVPVAICWWRNGMKEDLKLALAVGAVAGAGFGILEAQWVYNSVFATGWNWQNVQTDAVVALSPFWVRFFILGFHVAATAVAAYGMAAGWGWQSYLIVASLHTLMGYTEIMARTGLISEVQANLLIAALAVLVAGGAIWLRGQQASK